MYSKDDLDLSKVRHTFTSTNISENDSVLVFNGSEDINVRMHAATGSRLDNARLSYSMVLRWISP
jgi:hypothetical protein